MMQTKRYHNAKNKYQCNVYEHKDRNKK